MMMKKLDKQASIYKIDLSAVGEDGTFECPKCGKAISPDDESEDNYQILDTTVVNDELAELVISCATCKSTIKLTGFNQGFEA
jgi:hypothetical protein